MYCAEVDYTAAFVQAPIKHDVYVDLPQGWQNLNKMGLPDPFKAGHVLKLHIYLDGQCNVLHNFFEHLKGKLKQCGYKQSPNDPCLFMTNKVICVVYVDDCLFFAPNQLDIDASIDDIKKAGMDLNVEDDVTGFL